MKLRLRVLPVLLAATALIGPAACGSDDDDSNTSQSTIHVETTEGSDSNTATTAPDTSHGCAAGALPDSLPSDLPEVGQPASNCGLSLRISGSCEDNNRTGLAITGSGFPPDSQAEMRAWNVDTGQRYFDLANQGFIQVGPNGKLDIRPDDQSKRTWNCYLSSSGAPDPAGVYALAILDVNGNVVLATFEVDTTS